MTLFMIFQVCFTGFIRFISVFICLYLFSSLFHLQLRPLTGSLFQIVHPPCAGSAGPTLFCKTMLRLYIPPPPVLTQSILQSSLPKGSSDRLAQNTVSFGANFLPLPEFHPWKKSCPPDKRRHIPVAPYFQRLPRPHCSHSVSPTFPKDVSIFLMIML